MEQAALARILRGVEKPARYIGGEWNSIAKEHADVRFALCFPDVYEIGMSHLGSKILYHVLNSRAEIACERAYAPWPDMEQALRQAGVPLYSLETKRPLASFDIVGFSLLYEMCYTNILAMLDLAGIPLRAAERGADAPLIVCGGPCACNPEPLAPFMDAVMIGDGEEMIVELVEAYRASRDAGEDRRQLLHRLAAIEGVYVPSFYAPSPGGAVPVESGAPARVARRVLRDLEHAPYIGEPVVPYLNVVHDRACVEVMRGCTRGCRFCQAGYIYRPVRERTRETLLSQARALVDCTGYDEISLLSLSTGDYSDIHRLVPEIIDGMAAQRVSVSLPSLRIDSFLKEDLEKMQSIRKAGLTPTETDEDILGIAALCRQVSRLFYELPRERRGKGLRLSASASTFVPKPFTPFQWTPQVPLDEIRRRQQLLRAALKGVRGVEFHCHLSQLSVLEAAFSRGDRRLAGVLETAYRLGCRFDSWSEHFREHAWREAFAAHGLTMEAYAQWAPSPGDPLPWSHIDMLVTEQYLAREYGRAMEGRTTRDCRVGCNGCFGGRYADICHLSKG